MFQTTIQHHGLKLVHDNSHRMVVGQYGWDVIFIWHYASCMYYLKHSVLEEVCIFICLYFSCLDINELGV